MIEMLSWLITCLVVVLLLGFVVYVPGLLAIPTGERPRTRTYDRYGRLIGEHENPDYHENPGEDAREEPEREAIAG